MPTRIAIPLGNLKKSPPFQTTPWAVQREAAPLPRDAMALQAQRGNPSYRFRELAMTPAAGALDGAQIHAAARRGIQGAGSPLPHLETIQKSFGRHDVSGLVAHQDAAAREGALAMEAEAFATGDHVAFVGKPSLHTAAHEAAHAIQQRAGVHLQGGVGQVEDAHERHADAVAERVVQGGSSESLLDAYSGAAATPVSCVQRKVFIRKEQLEKKTDPTHREKTGRTSRSKDGQGNAKGRPTVRAMMKDEKKSYYFESKDEMSSYAKGDTEHIGHLDGKLWIRLDPQKLLVLGEYHSAAITLPNIVTAVQTSKWKYEPFVESADAPPTLAAALKARAAEWMQKMGLQDDASHTAEDFAPKILRSLLSLHGSGDTVSGDEGALRSLRWAILHVAASPQDVPSYRDHKEQFDQIAEKILNNQYAPDLLAYEEHKERPSLKAFVRDYQQYIQPQLRALKTTDATFTEKESKRFDKEYLWEVGLGGMVKEEERSEAPMSVAEEARDLSFYRHIKQARSVGCLLFGVGEYHRQRLAPMLKACEEMGIEHAAISEFLDQQEKNNKRAEEGSDELSEE